MHSKLREGVRGSFPYPGKLSTMWGKNPELLSHQNLVCVGGRVFFYINANNLLIHLFCTGNMLCARAILCMTKINGNGNGNGKGKERNS